MALAKDKDFERGADNAAIIFFYQMGKLRNEDANPHVVEAKALAERVGVHGAPEREKVGALLMQRSFFDEVVQRFGVGSGALKP